MNRVDGSLIRMQKTPYIFNYKTFLLSYFRYHRNNDQTTSANFYPHQWWPTMALGPNPARNNILTDPPEYKIEIEKKNV